MDRIIERVRFPFAARPKLKRVAAYTRVSTGKDAMLHSLSAQVSYYNTFIQSHADWQFCGVFSDEAVTGTKADRDGFNALLAECRQNRIDMIITKSISRFARNTVTLLETVRELRQLGVDVFFEEQNIHTMSEDGEIMLTLLASFAQAESLSASENQKWRIRRAFENGELINLRFLFGYDIKKGEIKPNPETSKIVVEIFDRFNKGESMTAICRELRRRNIPTVNGGIWQPEHILRILSNEKYTGNALLQKSYRNNHIEKRKTPNRGELPMYYAEDTHEAIVSSGTFSAAGERLKEIHTATSKLPERKKSIFAGLVKCGNCGRNYKRCTNNGKRFWNCPNYVYEGKSVCEGCRLPEETLISITEKVLGVSEIDEAAIKRIRSITVSKNILTFELSDDSVKTEAWSVPSRSQSWTAEMKTKAKADGGKHGKSKKSNGHSADN